MDSTFDLSEFHNTIFSQEDISLPVKWSAWGLFLHELEWPKKRSISPRKVLKRILAWMSIQKKKESLMPFEIKPIQKRILYLLAVEGKTQGQAALELHRSHETIKQDCRSLKRSLGVDSFYQVIAIAVALGWIPPPSLDR